MTRDVLAIMADAAVVAFRCRGEAWPRAFLGGTPIPDAWMGVVIRADGRRSFIPAGEVPRVGAGDVLAFVRNRALVVPVAVTEAPSADQPPHDVAAQVELLLRCPPREADLAALHEMLLKQPEFTLADLTTEMVRAGATQAVADFVRTRPAADLLAADPREPLLNCLRNALQPFLFRTGFELERLGTIEFRSATYTHQRSVEQAAARRLHELEARGAVERAALAATRRRLDDLGDVLARLRTAADAQSDLRWRELLPMLTPAERGRLLENLWRLTPDQRRAGAIVALTPFEVLWLAPAQPAEPLRKVALPTELGGLRSVIFDETSRTLLIGAATGVWQLAADTGEILRRFPVSPSTMPRTGFNSAVLHPEALFATSSQLGCWRWSLAADEPPQPVLVPTAGHPRALRATCRDAFGRVLFVTDDRVVGVDGSGTPIWESGRADAPLYALTPLEDQLYASTATGALVRTDLTHPASWVTLHRAMAPFESIQARRWDDLVELVIPAGGDGVVGVYAAEGFVARLLEGPYALRRAWATDDLLVALTEQRDALVVLTGEQPERRGLLVPLARHYGHSIQDAAIVLAPPVSTEGPRA